MSIQKIAIQGVPGSFHEQAAHEYFGTPIETVDCPTFKLVCENLANGRADFAIMAIENTLAGTILSNYNLLKDYHFKIIGEIYLRIEMSLIALPHTKLEDIQVIQSHPIALQQCLEFIWSLNHVEMKEHEDTAGSVKEISEKKRVGVAGIANARAADLYGMEILAKGIETNKQNFTRFIALARETTPIPHANKASLCLQVAHTPGSLAQILNTFQSHGINLTHIQSIPLRGKPYEYLFHIDVIWENYDDYRNALLQVLNLATNVSVLGEYKQGKLNY